MKKEQELPLSIKQLLTKHFELFQKLDGLPHVGSRPNSKEFFHEIKKVKEAFDLYGFSENLLDNYLPFPPKEKVRLGMGSPAAFPPFPPAKMRVMEAINSEKIHEYPLAGGDENARNEFIDYLSSIGFRNLNPYKNSTINQNGLSIDNVIFTSATTQAFDLILKLITKKDDIILMTAPNYGLFSFMPERIGARVELVHLKEKNNWFLDPEDLAKRIDILNNKYVTIHKGKSGQPPRVSAFVNMNPHNPLGKVMGKEHFSRLSQIGEICRQRGVFIIDDLVYRDLSFNRDDLAMPISSINGMFQNTISLFSLSKSYGMASIRAGAIVADETIIRGIRNSIFQSLDSISTLQVAAIAGAFNNSPERNEAYDKYFSQIIPEYQYRYHLVKALVDGVRSIKDDNLKDKIIDDVVSYVGYEKAKKILQGIDGVEMAKNTTPEAGFFALLDFSALKDKYYYGLKISEEKDLMKFLYCDNNIKFISGKSISWPNKKQFIGRITYALDRDILIKFISKIGETVGKLSTKVGHYEKDFNSIFKGIEHEKE